MDLQPEGSCSINSLARNAQWGDVILFRCSMLSAFALRALTLCPWDHVGVVARDRDGELLLLEACAAGTLVFPLERRLQDYASRYADRISWRRLVRAGSEDKEQLAAMHAFLDDVDGLRPATPEDAPKMLTTPAGNVEDDSKAGRPLMPPPPIEEAYFCSEIVVELWRRCGLVPPGTAAATYWPADLANGGKAERLLDRSSLRLEPERPLEIQLFRGAPQGSTDGGQRTASRQGDLSWLCGCRKL